MEQKLREKNCHHLKLIALNTKEQVKNFAVVLNSDQNFECHFRNVTKVSLYHLTNIAKVRPFLSQADIEKLIHAFISSSDYCNAVLCGVSKKFIGQLKLIQNTGSRILMKTRQRAQITPI